MKNMDRAFIVAVKMMVAKMVLPIAILLFCHNTNILASESKCDFSPHLSGWQMVLDLAAENTIPKYSIYSSRILAVHNPEVYLKADMLFVDSVNNEIFWALPRQGNFQKTVFDISKCDLSNYSIIDTKDFYSSVSSFYPFLDRRVFSPAVTTRKYNSGQIINQNHIKQIERAFLYYIIEKYFNKEKKLYVIYCSNENTYISSPNSLISMKSLKKVDTIIGDPILIFNEKYTWYPLMGRDDTHSDEELKELVDTFATDNILPECSEIEKKLIKKLQHCTIIRKNEEMACLLASAKTTSRFGFLHSDTTNKDILKLWNKVLSNYPNSQIKSFVYTHPLAGIDDFSLLRLTHYANYLSPFTAELATLSKINEIKGRLPALSIIQRYNKMGFNRCYLWTLGFDQKTIDESFFAGGGGCELHANNLSSILDLATIKNYVLGGYSPGKDMHYIVYLPKYEQFFSNNTLNITMGTLKYCRDALVYVSKGKDWSIFAENSGLVGNINPKKTITFLKDIKQIYNDDFKGIGIKKGFKRVLLAGLFDSTWDAYEISFKKLLEYIEHKKSDWKTFKLN